MRWITLLFISCFIVFTGCSDRDPTNDNNPGGGADIGLEPGEDANSDSSSDAANNESDTSQDVDPSITCASSEDCTDSSSVCDPMSQLCVDCLFDSQCADGGRCIERVCKTEGTCESDRDCADIAGKTTCNQALRTCVSACNNSLDCAQGDVCDPVQKQCVQCASNLDCGNGERCVASQCEAFLACQSDNQCTPHGLLCDVERGACNECENDAACPNAYHCAEGRCVVDICENDTLRCSNRNIEKCVDGKRFEVVESCQSPEVCRQDANAASCGSCTADSQCAPGFACNQGLCARADGQVCPTALAQARVAGTTEYSRDSLSAQPLNTIEFSGLESEGDNPRAYEWAILTRPTGSRAKLFDNATAEPELWLDLAGVYEIELVVFDADGVESCESSTVTIHAIPDQDVHIQLIWSAPAVPEPKQGQGTDMDLHYRHFLANQWNDAVYDIYWKNRGQNWGTSGNPSTATLDIDDQWGETTENINHRNPHDGNYEVGVHYYSENGFGPADATIRIYIQGQLAYEFLDQRLQHKHFWHVGSVQWPEKKFVAVNEIVCDNTLPGFTIAGCRP